MSLDVLWMNVIYLGIVYTIINSTGYRIQKTFGPKSIGLATSICFLFTLGSYDTSFGSHGYRSIQKAVWWPLKGEYGYYFPVERWDKRSMVWTMQKSSRRHFINNPIVRFELFIHPEICRGPEGLNVILSLNGSVLEERHFFKGGSRHLHYYLPEFNQKRVLLQMETNQTFQPSKRGINADNRELALAIGKIRTRAKLPNDGIGFYQWEYTKDVPATANLVPPDGIAFRWTRKVAAIPLGNHPQHWDTFFVRCTHPDAGKKPVTMAISDGQAVFQTIALTNSEWTEVVLDPEKLIGIETLAFRVDRTWNPHVTRGSKDGRDLGIAIANLHYQKQ
jgi:hypothetical protein